MFRMPRFQPFDFKGLKWVLRFRWLGVETCPSPSVPLDALHVRWYTGYDIHRSDGCGVSVGRCSNTSLHDLSRGEQMYDRKEADKRYRTNHRDEYNQRIRKYKKEHPEKTKEQNAEHRRTHQKEIIEYNTQYRETHQVERAQYNAQYYKEHQKDYKRRLNEWRKANPERAKIQIHNRRARKTQAGGSYTAEEWNALCKQCNHLCLCCNKRRKLVPDHVMPIAKGGTSNIDNIQPLCQPCNSRKGARFIDYRKVIALN
jgi:5-methylcytosine-specific restriction endonuclease McrA